MTPSQVNDSNRAPEVVSRLGECHSEADEAD